jgi:glycosyltransferase involved in cell wall biosynthesis
MQFSVIIPTYNRLPQLKLTLESVLMQTHSSYEVIVVDDGSTDGTEIYLKSLVERKVKYISQNNKGPAAARNNGIKLASGKFIAFTDDDCIVPADWLTRLENTFESTGADIVGGVVKNTCKIFFSEVSQQITNFFVRKLNEREASSFLTSNNIAYRAGVLKNAGGFEESFRKAGGEERALNWKIIMVGGKSVFAPDIVIEHYHKMGLSKFIRQQINYGRGSYLLYNIVGRKFKKPLPKIPISFYFLLCFSFFKENIFQGIPKVVFFILSQICVTLGFLLSVIQRKNK